MKCQNCGMDIVPGAVFCTGCGAKVPSPSNNAQNVGFNAENVDAGSMNNNSNHMYYSPPPMTPPPVMPPPIMPQPVFNNYNGFVGENGNIIPKEYKPISAWGYFGYNLLFCIPFVGFIFILVYALGGTSNINLKNYARSFFCMFVLILIIYLLIFMFIIVGSI